MLRWLNSLVTWWHGSNFGARLDMSAGREVGSDTYGNRYFLSKNGRKRFVRYRDLTDASMIPPEWHLWMHGRDIPPPSEKPLAGPKWVKPALPNLTGTRQAHMPSGSLSKVGLRARATGDYEAWAPE